MSMADLVFFNAADGYSEALLRYLEREFSVRKNMVN